MVGQGIRNIQGRYRPPWVTEMMASRLLPAIFISLVLLSCACIQPESPRMEIVEKIEIKSDLPTGPVFVPEKYKEVLFRHCFNQNVPYKLMARIAEVESGWKNRPSIDGHDHGIWQLNDWAMEHDFLWRFNGGRKVNPYDVEESTRIACQLMRWLYDALGSWELATMAYNCGLPRLLKEGPPESTKRYLRRVYRDT